MVSIVHVRTSTFLEVGPVVGEESVVYLFLGCEPFLDPVNEEHHPVVHLVVVPVTQVVDHNVQEHRKHSYLKSRGVKYYQWWIQGFALGGGANFVGGGGGGLGANSR